MQFVEDLDDLIIWSDNLYFSSFGNLLVKPQIFSLISLHRCQASRSRKSLYFGAPIVRLPSVGWLIRELVMPSLKRFAPHKVCNIYFLT